MSAYRVNYIVGLLKPVLLDPLKHLARLIVNPEFRRWQLLQSRLRTWPRYTPTTVNIKHWTLSIPDSASFLSNYREIFVNKIYDFPFSHRTPRILDLGANIGLSILFFKSRYPESRITAFEADPKIYNYLTRNVRGAGYGDVELINKAVWDSETKLKFSCEGADGGRVGEENWQDTIEVEAVDIRKYLQSHKFDFIKMDIEGAETRVFPACKNQLDETAFLFIEYHSRVGEKQRLGEIIGIMEEKGYRIHIQPVMVSPSPLIERRQSLGFDMQLNIFGWKE